MAGLKVRLKRVRGLTKKGILLERLYLPVVTGEFTWAREALHREYDTHAEGQFSVPAQGGRRARQLIEIGDLETMTLDWGNLPPWMRDHDPQKVKRQLQSVLEAKTPVELLATLSVHGGVPEELRCFVTLRRLEYTLRPGEADTRYWRIQVREFRENEVKRRSRHAREDKLPARHKLDSDDTLSKLSDAYYGSSSGWRLIARANGLGSWGSRTAIVKHAKFKVGDRLKIPKPETTVRVRPGRPS